MVHYKNPGSSHHLHQITCLPSLVLLLTLVELFYAFYHHSFLYTNTNMTQVFIVALNCDICSNINVCWSKNKLPVTHQQRAPADAGGDHDANQLDHHLSVMRPGRAVLRAGLFP